MKVNKFLWCAEGTQTNITTLDEQVKQQAKKADAINVPENILISQ